MSCFWPAGVADVVAQQRLRPEAEAFEDRDSPGLVDRHLHQQLLQPAAERQREGLLRQRPPDPEAAHIR